MKTKLIVPKRAGEDPIKLLEECGGYYKCPRGPNNEVLGPLVGYAAQYEEGKHWVGFEYANFAKAEEQPFVLEWVARALHFRITRSVPGHVDGYCGAPQGGLALATVLSQVSHTRYLFMEKEVVRTKSSDCPRGESRLVFSRHKPEPGDRLVIGEDVVNNVSSAEEMIQRIVDAGASVAAIACFLNRSPEYDAVYPSKYHGDIPIISVVRQVIPEYHQDAPEVAAEVAKGNVIWKPKDNWAPLAEAMARHPQPVG